MVHQLSLLLGRYKRQSFPILIVFYTISGLTGNNHVQRISWWSEIYNREKNAAIVNLWRGILIKLGDRMFFGRAFFQGTVVSIGFCPIYS